MPINSDPNSSHETGGPDATASTRPGRTRDWILLSLGMAAYAVLFAAFYPPLAGIEDEVGFLNQTLVWSHGAVSSEGAGLRVPHDFIEVRGRHVPARHPGRSLVALPFLMVGGVRATFASGLVVHLATTALAALVLTRLGRSPLWAALVLFHPTLATYSRTITADSSAGGALLIAALALTSRSALAGVLAGVGVGIAAFMRYHAALALPVVAASFAFPAGRPRPWRDAILCVVTAAACGGLIVGYNLVVYGTPTEPFTGGRGTFLLDVFVPHLVFYSTALAVVWPAMLLAPVLDRSALRWLVRGLCGLFFGFLTFYYFHDRGSSWAETLVVGQRLLQVALPIWIVSYAGVLDDWVVAPARRALGERAWGGLVAISCVVLFVAIGVVFQKHQRHLETLLEAREAIVENVPPGSLILYEGGFFKLVDLPGETPDYRIRELTYLDQPKEDPKLVADDLRRETRPWYLAVLGHRSRTETLTAYPRSLVGRFEMVEVPTRSSSLVLYVHRKGGPTPGPEPKP